MNHFVSHSLPPGDVPSLLPGEFHIRQNDEAGVRLDDGNHKTPYENGSLLLTSHHLLWLPPSHASSSSSSSQALLALPLVDVLGVQDEPAGFMRSEKIVVRIKDANCPNLFVRLAFKQGGMKPFFDLLRDVLAQKQWEIAQRPATARKKAPAPARKVRSGIGGIEKSIASKAKQTDTEISKAFQDLNKLIQMAKPMVSLAKSMSAKIRDKQGEVSDDETIQFKSYLLSLGISDPVTKDAYGSSQAYHRELAKEIFKILEKPILDAGGMMTLTDCFCRVNRARGLELLSPEDLLHACRALQAVQLPLRLHTFDSGVQVLRLSSHTDEALLAGTEQALRAHDELSGLTAEELSRTAGVSVVLAKERLLAAEARGLACRDDTLEGLRFYTNRLLNEE